MYRAFFVAGLFLWQLFLYESSFVAELFFAAGHFFFLASFYFFTCESFFLPGDLSFPIAFALEITSVDV